MSRSSAPGRSTTSARSHRAPGPADLLVVGDGRGRRAEVHDEAEVRLVEPHAQRAGGHQRLDPVRQQVRLRGQPLLRIGLAGVGRDREPALAQELRDLLRGGDGERVHDPGARQLRQVRGEPPQPLRGRRQPHHRQPQALPVQRAAQHQRLPGREPQLLGDVADHPVVRRRRGGQHRDPRRQLGDQRAQPAVVGPEVVPPVRHAVRLVHHQQTRARREPGEHPVAEVGVVQPLRADQQDVHLAGVDRGVGGLPVVGVRRVHRDRLHPGPGRGVDLVAHQREQRRDDDRGPRAGRPQQRGGHEVHRRLAPSGALHDQRPAPLHDQGVDRRPLVVAQPRAQAPRASRSTSSARARRAVSGTLGRRHPHHRDPDPRQFRDRGATLA